MSVVQFQEFSRTTALRIMEVVLQIDLRTIAAILVCLLVTFAARVVYCLPRGGNLKKDKKKASPLSAGKVVKTMVYFGSGGHTMEMIRLITNLDPSKYSPICFAIGHTDITSVDKVQASGIRTEKRAHWLRVFRNREVKQSWFTTIFTSIWSLIQAFYVVYVNYTRVMLYVVCCMFRALAIPLLCGWRAMAVDCSILLLPYSTYSCGALESPDLLLSYSMTTLALHHTVILIIAHLSFQLIN